MSSLVYFLRLIGWRLSLIEPPPLALLASLVVAAVRRLNARMKCLPVLLKVDRLDL